MNMHVIFLIKLVKSTIHQPYATTNDTKCNNICDYESDAEKNGINGYKNMKNMQNSKIADENSIKEQLNDSNYNCMRNERNDQKTNVRDTLENIKIYSDKQYEIKEDSVESNVYYDDNNFDEKSADILNIEGQDGTINRVNEWDNHVSRQKNTIINNSNTEFTLSEELEQLIQNDRKEIIRNACQHLNHTIQDNDNNREQNTKYTPNISYDPIKYLFEKMKVFFRNQIGAIESKQVEEEKKCVNYDNTTTPVSFEKNIQKKNQEEHLSNIITRPSIDCQSVNEQSQVKCNEFLQKKHHSNKEIDNEQSKSGEQQKFDGHLTTLQIKPFTSNEYVILPYEDLNFRNNFLSMMKKLLALEDEFKSFNEKFYPICELINTYINDSNGNFSTFLDQKSNHDPDKLNVKKGQSEVDVQYSSDNQFGNNSMVYKFMIIFCTSMNILICIFLSCILYQYNLMRKRIKKLKNAI